MLNRELYDCHRRNDCPKYRRHENGRRFCRTPQSDNKNESCRHMELYSRPTKYAQIGGFSAISGQRMWNSARRIRGKRQAGNFANKGQSGRVFAHEEPPKKIRLHTKTHELVESNRALVFNFGKKTTTAQQFQISRGIKRAQQGIHCVFQSNNGKAIQMDIQGATFNGLKCLVISAQHH